MNNNNFEDNLSSLCKYGLRYFNNDILNCINDRNDKILNVIKHHNIAVNYVGKHLYDYNRSIAEVDRYAFTIENF